MGVVALILGILSLILGWFMPGFFLIIAIVGIILGAMGKKQGNGVATAGMVISIIATVIMAITFLSCLACSGCNIGVAMFGACGACGQVSNSDIAALEDAINAAY